MSFWGELKRRNVVKVGVAYAIVGWLLAQAAALLETALELPYWFDGTIVSALLLAFPIALLLAWAYELTPEGIKKTREVPLEESVHRLTGQKLNYVVTGLLVAAIAFLFVDDYLLDDDRRARSTDSPGADAAATIPSSAEGAAPAATAQTPRENSLAVLPFDNLSENVDDAHFAAGLHDEVLNQLAKLRSLKVISRSSVLRYAGNRPSIRDIGAELNVEAVMEGTVRYAGNQVMVTAQLIDATTDIHLWSDTFRADRSNVEEIFSIQTDVATAIATALGAEISPADRTRIDRMPTESGAAYARYLSAREHYAKTEFGDALREFDLAIDLDPDFAEAYAQRAVIYAYGQITSNARAALLGGGSTTNDFQALALADAAKALDLYEGAAMAWVARAVTHEFHYRWNEAEEAFARAALLSPNDSAVLQEYALFRFFRGDIAGALEMIRRTVALDPNGVLTLVYWSLIAEAAGHRNEALEAAERCFAADPTSPQTNTIASLYAPDASAAARYLRAAEELTVGYRAMFLLGTAAAYQRIGLDRDAERVLDRYRQFAEGAPIGMGDWARYYLLSGDEDQAYVALRSAVEKFEAGQADAGYLAIQQGFANPADPRLAENRFQDLLARLQALEVD